MKERNSKNMTHVTCQEEVSFICDYLADNLSVQNSLAFENHLKACPDCVAFLATYKKTIAITRSFLSRRSLQETPRKLSFRAPAAEARRR